MKKFVSLSTGVRIEYAEQGKADGVPVILLHGVTDSWRSFERVLPLLPPNVHAFALSQRGHGDSSRPTSGYRFADMSADLLAFLDAMGLRTAIIVGHSMGASVAQRFVIDHPDRVARLVLMGAFSTYHDPGLADFVASSIAPLTDPIAPPFAREWQLSTLARAMPADHLDAVVSETLKVPARVWREAFDGFMKTPDFTSELTSVSVPVLLMWGDRDSYALRAAQDRLLEVMPKARFIAYQGFGHAFHWEDPEQFTRDLVPFLTSRTGRDSLDANEQSPIASSAAMGMGNTVRGMNESRAARFENIRLKTGPRLHYVECGSPDGEPVVFLHGWPDSWFSFSRLLPLLPESLRAVAVDQRGFGDSDRPESGYAIPEMAADVIALFDALQINRATLVGHSFGSFVARQVAIAQPQRVAALALIGTGFAASTPVMRDLQNVLRDLPDPIPVEFARDFQASTVYGSVPTEFFERIVAESLKLPPRLWRLAIDRLVEYDDSHQVATIEAPTLLLWGDRDALFSRADQDRFMATLPAARLTVYEDTGHCPNWERPEQVAADIAALVLHR